MPHATIVPAVAWLLLTAFVNYRFAETLASDPEAFALWCAVGLAAATYSAFGLAAVSDHWNNGRTGRCAAAAGLLVLSVGYDGLAGYGVSRFEQHQAEQRAEQSRRFAEAARDTAERATERLGAYAGVVATAEARGALDAARSVVSDAQCLEVTGPNRLSRVAAERVRAACDVLAEARRVLAKAQARDALEAAATEARLAAARAATRRTDPRIELLGETGTAWLPVILITAGALLGLFVSVKPRAPTKPIAKPRAGAAATEPEEPESEIVERLAGILRDPDSAPDRLEIDIAAKRITGPQRPMAEACGIPLTRFSRELKNLKASGRVSVDIRNNRTAITLQ